jgi:hypothetical protein
VTTTPPAAPFRFPSALALVAAFATVTALPAQAGLAKDRADGAAAVTLAQCKEWLGTLASPEFEGRGTGQPGYEKAANYVAEHFHALGLEARGENGSYFQHVPWATTKVVADKTQVVFKKGDAVVLTIPAEQLAGSASASITGAGEVVLLTFDAPEGRGRGQGIEIPALKDLEQADLAGKVVVVHVRPGKDGNARGQAGAQFAAISALSGKRAAAVLFATTEPTRGGLQGRRGMGRRGGNTAAAAAGRSPGAVTFGGEQWAQFLNVAAITPDALANAPLTQPTCVTASVAITVEETNAPAMNVWAVLPGSDATLRDEYVVIGSHLDHLGRRGDVISPGADDDASGTTGVMAVARMLAKNPVRPARSVLFVCFAGEENGLVGSAHFADNCPIPLSSMVAELQMDMIGRDEEENMEGNRGEKAEDNRNSIHLVGTQKLAPSLHALCLQKNEAAKFDLEYDQEGMFGRSDHANFARKGVPVAFFFTGLHRDYHQPTDTPEKIHYEKLLRVATWVYDIAFELATQPGRPEIEPELWAKYRAGSRNQAPEQPAAPLAKAKAADDGR